MDDFDDNKIENIFSDLVSLLDEKDKIILSQEKDIGSLKREICDLKSKIDCFQSEKEK